MSEKRAYVSEADYARRMKETVLPYLNARRYDGYFAGYDGNLLHYVKYAAGGGDGGAAQKTAIISHGFTESAEKWRELAFYFLQEGYNVYIPEHRGHGLSYRKTADKTLTHIDRFSEYADDFEIFCDTVRAETTGEIYLYAHSMGCAIGLLFMERHPAFFKKAFLSSPMVVPESRESASVVGAAAYENRRENREIRKARVYFFAVSRRRKIRRFCAHFAGAVRRIQRVQAHARRLSELFFHVRVGVQFADRREADIKKGRAGTGGNAVFIAAAENDTLVLRKPQIALSNRLKNCRFEVFAGAKHEIYGSEDGVAFGYFDAIFDFFAAP